MSSGVSLALVPSEKDCQAICALLAESERSGVDFAVALNTSNSIAHLSLMQATFDDGQTAVDLLQFLNIASIPRFLKEPMAITDISVWASKIVFLNFALGPALKQLHCDVANLWLPKALRASADPQSFVGISDGQRQSISSTGYPFSYDEYLPHITLGHLKTPLDSVAKTVRISELDKFNELLETRLPPAIRFEKLVAFEVEPLGLCRQIIREWQI
ncbi:hypothetical protein KBI23_13385 [bacterium]|nr:hypothetical protein [bacterium]MBP9807545.1 hypothetical protein [bacterium]